MPDQRPRLELRGITRRFGTVVANDCIDLLVAPSQIHALLGENGAGKSTLVKMVCGVLRPDEGELLWDGAKLQARGPGATRRAGISMVSQHFSLFEAMSVLENIALGLNHPGPLPRLARRIEIVSAAYGLPLDPARRIDGLSVGERQRVEIVRCLLQEPRLLILDEPTSVLTSPEVDTLFATLRRLAAEGCSILYISHRLEEIGTLCNVATVMRAGRVVATCDPDRETAASLARMMMGAEPPRVVRPRQAPRGPRRLLLDAMDLPAEVASGVALREVTLEVHGGEIVGIAGIAGNGQAELFAAITGERLAQRASDVLLGDVACGRDGTARRRVLGLCSAPDDRLGHAAVPAFPLTDNALLTARAGGGLVRAGLVRGAAVRCFAEGVIADYGVSCPGPDAPASTLSGGNLQKFILGREIRQNPKVLLVAQPTWGVDANAAALIHQALLDLAATGTAVLLISQNVDELFALCDRIGVIHAGQLSPPRPTSGLSAADIGLLMGGATRAGRHAA